MQKEKITICGAGLVGSLLSIYLIQRGFDVRVIEKRSNPLKSFSDKGRSINLAISHRGIHALANALPDLEKKVLKGLAVPMHGRQIHDMTGRLSFQPYGKSGQHINSIGRTSLNKLLIEEAIRLGVHFLFEHTCNDYNESTKKWSFQTLAGDYIYTDPGEVVIGADGAFSMIREKMHLHEKQYRLDELDYGYIELDIISEEAIGIAGREALHIWPRERFMLIALPNNDGSFTATLFLPMEGALSFSSLDSNDQIKNFFNTYFPDTKKLLPDVPEQFLHHQVSKLFTVHADKWYNSHTLLIGDAAHALVPFYGQGMNAGFEDCRILAEIIDRQEVLDWERVFKEFFHQRKKNADAISDLALQNFIEMRDLVADESFLIRKKIESYLHSVFPETFIPQYTMVSFTDTSYSDAVDAGIFHEKILNEIMEIAEIKNKWPDQEVQAMAKNIALKYL